ncbi:DUF445 family protein [Fibrobacter sp.]|uniref:DUF445 family protein n=1 Tax=Fibrobacter sp. TaxID=35828 RepID=UPI00388E3B9E
MNIWKKLDKLFNIISWLIIVIEVVYITITWTNSSLIDFLKPYASWIMPIALTGAVGYLTNWIALWLLFKPYEPWPRCCKNKKIKIQGIIPKNKGKMAVSFGNMVGQRLLKPDAIVNEMKEEVLKFVRNTEQIKKLNQKIQDFIQKHEDEIVDFITPYIERQVLDIIDNIATEKNWEILWDEGILPRIKSDETRHFIVQKIVELIHDNAGKIVDEVRTELRSLLWNKLDHWYIPTTKIVNAVMDNFADELSLRNKLDDWLRSEETQETLRRNLIIYADQLTIWMKSSEGQKVLGNVIREIRFRGKNFLKRYIKENIPNLINKAFSSELLYHKLEKNILPHLGNKLTQLIDKNKPAILEKLRLEQRVTETVNGMDVRDFHGMLNDFLGENFCAIQVLGFIIGIIVGAVQLLAKINT